MIIHVDMSCKFYEGKKVGVAWIDSDKKEHKGMALSKNLIYKLNKSLAADSDFPRLYAICIYLLIKNDLNRINKIIICNDEPFSDVKKYLTLLTCHQENLISIQSITEYKKELGKKKLKSKADSIVNSYRKRASLLF